MATERETDSCGTQVVPGWNKPKRNARPQGAEKTKSNGGAPLRVEALLLVVVPAWPWTPAAEPPPLPLLGPSFSTFSKHLLRLRLWRTEFFQPAGAVRKYGKCSLRKIHRQVIFLSSIDDPGPADRGTRKSISTAVSNYLWGPTSLLELGGSLIYPPLF